MRLAGLTMGGRSVVVEVDDHETPVGVVAGVEEFWDDPFSRLAGYRADVAHGLVQRPAPGAGPVPPVRTAALIACVGLNYASHAEEVNRSIADAPPTVFLRHLRSLACSGAVVPVPPDEDGLDWEGELAVVVGRSLRHATPEQAREAIFGFAAFNDLTGRRAQRATTQWTLGKNAERSGVLGAIVTRDTVLDPQALRLETLVNGVVMQSASTADMVRPVEDLLVYLSRYLRLCAGDIVVTGTPAGVGVARKPPVLLGPGDRSEVRIGGLGSVVAQIGSAEPSRESAEAYG